MRRIAVVLAGGSGSRLYPISTEDKPKQFLKLLSNNMMIEDTIDRISDIYDHESIYINTICKYSEYIKELPYRSLIEEKRQGTTRGIEFIVNELLRNYGDCIITLLPSDHYIRGNNIFIDNLNNAIDIAIGSDNVVLIGIEPHEPNEGYGYLDNHNGDVIGFKEKPSLDMAKFYIEKGHLWNSGIFTFRASVMCDLYKRFINDDENIIGVFEKDILEKADNVKVVKGLFYWSDIGDLKRYIDVIRIL